MCNGSWELMRASSGTPTGPRSSPQPPFFSPLPATPIRPFVWSPHNQAWSRLRACGLLVSPAWSAPPLVVAGLTVPHFPGLSSDVTSSKKASLTTSVILPLTHPPPAFCDLMLSYSHGGTWLVNVTHTFVCHGYLSVACLACPNVCSLGAQPYLLGHCWVPVYSTAPGT